MNSLASVESISTDSQLLNTNCGVNDALSHSSIGLGLEFGVVENITDTKNNTENKDEIDSTSAKVMDLGESDTYFDGIQTLMDASW